MPEVVTETGDLLEKRAYALIMENGYPKHDRFPFLEAAWPGIAPALPLFLAGDWLAVTSRLSSKSMLSSTQNQDVATHTRSVCRTSSPNATHALDTVREAAL
jgi:hypothetical protein